MSWPFPHYWHVFAGEVNIFGTECWVTTILGPSENAVPLADTLPSGVRWVQTLSRLPTDNDLALHTPREFLE